MRRMRTSLRSYLISTKLQQDLVLSHNINLRTIRELYRRVRANPNFRLIQGVRRAINFQMRLHSFIVEAFGGMRIDIRMQLDHELEDLNDIAVRLEQIEEYMRTTADMTDVFYQEQRERLKNKFNNLILVIGPPGVGKTMCSRNVSENMDKTFKLSRDLFFLGSGFLTSVKESQKGKYHIFDEPKAELEARRGMEKGRPEMNLVFTVFRIKQINILLATPFPDDIDRNDRRLIWSLLNVIDRGIALWYQPQPAQTGADPKDFANWELRGRVYFDNIEDEEWAEYERKKNEFIEKIVHKAEEKIAEREGRPAADRGKVIAELIEKVKNWLRENKIKKPTYMNLHEFLIMEASEQEIAMFKDPKDESALLNRILREKAQPIEPSQPLNGIKSKIMAAKAG